MHGNARLRLLLEKGYFPEPLPPPFSTQDYARAAPVLVAGLLPPQNILKSGFGVEQFAIPKGKHSRRILGIPNPFPQLALSKLIAAEWPDLVKHFAGANLSLSVPRFRKTKRRATEPTSREKLDEKHALLSSGYRYVLQTDI